MEKKNSKWKQSFIFFALLGSNILTQKSFFLAVFYHSYFFLIYSQQSKVTKTFFIHFSKKKGFYKSCKTRLVVCFCGLLPLGPSTLNLTTLADSQFFDAKRWWKVPRGPKLIDLISRGNEPIPHINCKIKFFFQPCSPEKSVFIFWLKLTEKKFWNFPKNASSSAFFFKKWVPASFFAEVSA